MKKKYRENWWLGFLGFFGVWGIPELLTQDWFGTIWVLWFIWFIYFLPIKKEVKNNGKKNIVD